MNERAKRAAQAVMAAILFAFIVGALFSETRAQTPPVPEKYCLPKVGTVINGTGTAYGTFETLDVAGRVGWCPSNSGGWYIVIHQWNLQKTKAPLDGMVGDAIDRVLHSSDPVAQALVEWSTYRQPLVTDLDKWNYRTWRYQACQWLTSTQPGVTPRPPMPVALDAKNPDGSAWVPPMDYCEAWNPGAKPSPDAGWKATGSYIFLWSGTRLTNVTTRKATPGAPCDGMTKITVGTTVYQSLVGGPAGEVTGCAK